MSAIHHNGSKRGALGELGRCTSKDDCPGTAALDEIPVTTVHPPIAAAIATIDLITEAVAILARHPLIGRTVEADLRELVISRGARGPRCRRRSWWR